MECKNAINFLNCDIRYAFKLKMRPNQGYFNVNLCEEDVEYIYHTMRYLFGIYKELIKCGLQSNSDTCH